MLIHISHEKLAEVSNDGATDTLVRDPLDDRLGLDVAQLFKRDFLHITEQEPTQSARSTYILYTLQVIHIFPFVILPSRTSLRTGE